MWSDVNVETGAVHVVPAFNEVLEESRRKRGNKGENNGSNGPTKGNKKTGPDRKTGVTEPNIRSPSKTRPTWRGQEGSLKLSRFRFFYPESLPSHHPNLRQTDPYAYCEARFLDLLELVFVHNVLVAFVSHHVGALHAVCRARTRVWLYTTFMPVGYPDSVGEEYLEFQIYDCIQGLCSYLRTVLCTKALLEGAGLGTVTSTSALAAALVWVSRDMCGMVANLLFASAYSQSFSSYVKEWRLFADIANDVGQTLDMLAPWTANGQTLWIPLHSIRFGVKYLVEATNFFLLSGLEWRAWDILVDYWIALLNSMQRDVFLPFYLYFLSPLGGVFPALLDNLPTGVADALRSLVDPELVYTAYNPVVVSVVIPHRRGQIPVDILSPLGHLTDDAKGEGFTQDVLSDWHNVSTGKTSLSRSGSFAKPGFRLTTPPTTFWEQPVLYLFGTPCSCVIRVFYCMVGNLRLFLTSLHDYIPLWVNTEVSFYLILLSVSAICKAVCGVSAGAAKLCTTYHFSLGRR
ncbi:unnamed protein product [Amoebophrya sp. A25]|nr:unnamed protein product [Amoebophrya sp. A25]|eukprot:GSA25T00018113001.1